MLESIHSFLGLEIRSVDTLIFIVLITIFGGIYRAYTGFGAGLVLVPAFSLLLQPVDAIILVAILNQITMLQLLPGSITNAPWKEVTTVTIASIVTTPLGVYLLTVSDADLLKRGLGLLVVASSLLLLSGWKYRGAESRLKDAAVGAMSGTLSGWTGMGGPPVILYFLSKDSISARTRAAFIVCFALTMIVALLGYTVAGLMQLKYFVWAAALLPIYGAATWAGAILYGATQHIEQIFRIASLACLIVIGLITMAS